MNAPEISERRPDPRRAAWPAGSGARHRMYGAQAWSTSSGSDLRPGADDEALDDLVSPTTQTL